MNNQKKFRIWLVDDHILLRESLANNIKLKAPHFQVEKQASNGRELNTLLAKHKMPDLVLLDLEMKEFSGFKFLENKENMYPDLKILVLSMHSDEITVINAFKKNIQGYITKNILLEELIFAIETVLEGKKYIQTDLEQFYDIESNTLRGTIADFNITNKEREFIKMACSDYTYDQIAEKLSVSVNTIETHRTNTFKKLNIRTRVGLMLIAQKNNWI